MNALILPSTNPDLELYEILDQELDTATLAESRDQKVYKSLLKLSELIGGEYGDRVLYELLQNAHDAQPKGAGEVAIRLVVRAADRGELYVANAGHGFTKSNLQAVRNIANSTKTVGEGIGNKGVGFRSVEALTNDPHVYSCRGEAAPRERFDGYCFRFAKPEEVKARLIEIGNAEYAEAVSSALPRYLAALPVAEQSGEVLAFARRGYATVVHLPLRSTEAVSLAVRQVRELVASEAPVLLFLDRLAGLEVEVEGVPEIKPKVRLTRHVQQLDQVFPNQPLQTASLVTLGPERRRWLLLRRTLPKEGVLAAVDRSVPHEAGLKSWREWLGDAVVSVATPWDGHGLKQGRLYNFLPMDASARSPCFGHVDAPFYTNISRRQAKMDLPLNVHLIDSAAEICASAALVLVGAPETPTRAVVDLVAWQPSQNRRLDAAFKASGTSLSEAQIWPTSLGGWANFREVRAWPDASTKVFTHSRATRAGVSGILSPKLDADRVNAFHALGAAANLRTHASGATLATWAERVASILPRPTKTEDRWGQYYADLVEVCDTDDLLMLQGCSILLDRDGHLRPASSDVYVRQEGGRRRKDGAPVPPPAVSKKLVLLSDQIRLSPETIAAFEHADLWRRYDATEILERLPSLFGEKPAPMRRAAALSWAFDVWRYDTQGARRVLEAANLFVPTRSGWRPAAEAAFGEGWTESGRDLDAFLAEAREVSVECDLAANSLLEAPPAWPVTLSAALSEWVRFLGDAGVSDGFVAVPESVDEGPFNGGEWSWRLQRALGEDWKAHSWSNAPSFPYTQYWRVGDAWKAPGQESVEELSEEARRRFAMLLVRHLQATGDAHLTFKISRKDRAPRDHDERRLATPLANFLATADWVPLEGPDGLTFVSCAEAWLVTDRRSEPRFVPRIPDDLAHVLSRAEKALDVLTQKFGLRRWREKLTAPARLITLAEVCELVAQPERPQLRRHYDQAWEDLLAESLEFEDGTPLIVERPGGFGCLRPSADPQPVYLRDERNRDLGQLLADSGQAVLAIGAECPAEEVAAAINATGDFQALSVDAAEIHLLVDGETFEPDPSDPLLVDVVPWLAEALVLGHELGARNIEKGAHVDAVLDRLRRVRLRRAGAVELRMGQGPARRLEHHLHRAERSATLIVEEPFGVPALEACATLLTNYVHQNLRTFELLLVKLSHRLPADADLTLVRPSDLQYADAMRVELEAVREHLAAFRHDDGGKVELLLPLLAYVLGAESARALAEALAGSPRKAWTDVLRGHLPEDRCAAFLTAMEESDDLYVIRQRLGLDYAQLNRAVIALGRPPLTSEAELRRLFDARLNEIRADLVDRLRRHFAGRFQDGAAMAEYAEAKSLNFIAFNPAWIETEEVLSQDIVRKHAGAIIAGRFGADPGGKLLALENLKSSNRRSIGAFAERALPILQAAAGDRLHSPWKAGSKEVVDALDRGGYLDFRALKTDAEILPVAARAGLWPDGIPITLDLATLGLTDDDLNREKREAAQRRAEEARRKNRVEFSGQAFDSAADGFAEHFAAAAHAAFEASDWRARSKLRLADLQLQPEPDAGGARPPGGRGPSRAPSKPPEPVRVAVGLAGELLAFRYLQAKHRNLFSEACWESENRTSLFAEGGDDRKGYDFRVNTSEREWLYEVKATPNDAWEFELSDNEYRVAAAASAHKTQTYRILFVQYALDPTRCRVLELPNPAALETRSRFRIVGRSALRMRFELS